VSNLLKKEKGFTLIEIVLVLAIASLLLVIVFLAVSGAQKSRRDSQRKNDLSRVAAGLESYASNNTGAYPATQAAFNTAFGAAGPYDLANANDPLSGKPYTYAALVTPSGATSAGLSYALGQDCSGAATGTRVYAVTIGLEQGTSFCQSNK
jgi:prepilin-type N-terminal cleavage/methylation domain-containing protein